MIEWYWCRDRHTDKRIAKDPEPTHLHMEILYSLELALESIKENSAVFFLIILRQLVIQREDLTLDLYHITST